MIAQSKARDIIDSHICQFKQEIESICRIDCKKIHTEKSDFPIFRPANQEFFEYKYYEGVLEWYIRDHLVTDIFCELFEEDGKRVVPCPNEKPPHIRFKYPNDAFGRDHSFAFIVQQNTQNFAVCYTSPYFEEDKLDKLFSDYNLNHIEVIDWDDNGNHSKKVPWDIPYNSRSKCLYINLRDFFVKHFSKEIYYLYIESVISAVSYANKEIGFNTIPNLSLRYLSDFKASVMNALSEFPLEKEAYQEFSKHGEPIQSYYELLPDDDYRIILERLNTDGLLPSLIGNEKFAKCFLTSEYLYQIFENGNECYFDYSSVATGYFKSVELLLQKIMLLTLECEGHDELWIKCANNNRKKIDDVNFRRNPNPKVNAIQVRFSEDNVRFFATEMGPLIWFLHDRNSGWKISDVGKDLVHKCLLNYNQGCRNEHLHKDVIDDIETIRIIRKNTILCLCFLLGGCKLTDNDKKDYTQLGIEKNSYDNLYKKLLSMPRSVNCFYIQFCEKGVIKTIRLYDQEKPQYDDHGNILSPVRFVAVDDFSIGDYEMFLSKINDTNKVIIDRTNLPEKIWWYNRYKGKVEIKW